MAVYTRLITTSFGARVEYEDRFAGDCRHGSVRTFSSCPAAGFLLRSNYLCSPPTYLHTHTRLRETKGAFGPNKPSKDTSDSLPTAQTLQTYIKALELSLVQHPEVDFNR